MIEVKPQPEPIKSNGEISISVEEYDRLKDIETRFTIMRDELFHLEYIPIHHQIILGIEKEYAAKHREEGIKWDPLNPKKKYE